MQQEHERGGEVADEEVPKLQRQNTRDEHDRAVLGLALYALSSCFLATALVFTKKLSEPRIHAAPGLIATCMVKC